VQAVGKAGSGQASLYQPAPTTTPTSAASGPAFDASQGPPPGCACTQLEEFGGGRSARPSRWTVRCVRPGMPGTAQPHASAPGPQSPARRRRAARILPSGPAATPACSPRTASARGVIDRRSLAMNLLHDLVPCRRRSAQRRASAPGTLDGELLHVAVTARIWMASSAPRSDCRCSSLACDISRTGYSPCPLFAVLIDEGLHRRDLGPMSTSLMLITGTGKSLAERLAVARVLRCVTRTRGCAPAIAPAAAIIPLALKLHNEVLEASPLPQ